MKAAIRTLISMTLLLVACISTTSYAQDIEQEKKGVVKITSQADGANRTGTGFIAKLDKDAAYIVTASHVIEGDSKPQVYFYPDATKGYRATIIGTEGDLPRGLALIRVQGLLPSGLAHLGIDASFNLEAAEQVTIIGFPRLAGIPWAYTPITIVGRQGTAITFTGGADEGSSGSPVLRNGWVTAIVAEKSGDYGYAVPSMAIRFAIEGWGLKLTAEAAMPTTPQARQAAPQGNLANTRLLFMSSRDKDTSGNNQDIFVMNSNGSGVKRVTPKEASFAHDAGWTRDGKSMTYVVDDIKMTGVYIADLTTGKTVKLTQREAYYGAPTWSLSGDQLIFLANTAIDRDYTDIFIKARDSETIKQITHKPTKKASIFWSPKGDKIGYAEQDKKTYKTYFMNVDGTNLQELSSPLTDFAAAAWSPDGAKLVGDSNHDGFPAIYKMNPDGSDPVRLTNHPEGDVGPDWSPDGSKIVFTSLRDGHAELYVMNADGSNQVRLTSGKASNFNPQWSPFPR
jgi:Tol biopolymer transport system component